MTRFKVLEEKTKVGRKTEVQYAVFDALDSRVVVRYALEFKAEFVCDQMNEAHELSKS